MERLKGSLPNHSVVKDFFSFPYLITQFFTLAIFFLGFKWTLLGLYWLPFMFNPFIYTCIIIFWFYYNFMWIRTALYIPNSMLLIDRTYKSAGVKLSLWKMFYLALCKVPKLRKEDMKVKNVRNLIRVLARNFMKHGIILNFRRDDAEVMSTALFIHKKRTVFSYFKAIVPYLLPAFIAILILTPTIAFLSSFNYRYLMEKLAPTPMFMTFGMYILILPFSLTWIFLSLNLLAANLLGPLVTLPSADLYGPYLKDNKVEIDFNKKQTPSFEGMIAVIMLCASVAFYFSTIIGKYSVVLESVIS